MPRPPKDPDATKRTGRNNNDKKKTKEREPPMPVFGAYSEEAQDYLKGQLVIFPLRGNDTYKELSESLNILAHATMLGYVPRSIANAMTYMYQAKLLVMQQQRLYENPTGNVGNQRFFDPTANLQIPVEQLDQFLKASTVLAQMTILEKISRSSVVDVTPPSMPALDKRDPWQKGVSRLIDVAEREASKPLEPERVDEKVDSFLIEGNEAEF